MDRKFPTWGQAEEFAEESKRSPVLREVDVRPTPFKASREEDSSCLVPQLVTIQTLGDQIILNTFFLFLEIAEAGMQLFWLDEPDFCEQPRPAAPIWWDHDQKFCQGWGDLATNSDTGLGFPHLRQGPLWPNTHIFGPQSRLWCQETFLQESSVRKSWLSWNISFGRKTRTKKGQSWSS